MRRCLLFAALLVSTAGILFGQEIVRRSDTLSAGDERYENGAPIRWYSVAVKGGMRLAIRVASVDFTPTIIIRGDSGSDQKRSGSAGSAGFSYSTDSDGSIKVGVTTGGSGEAGGSYLVRMRLIAPEAPITVGERRSASLDYDNEALEEGRNVAWFPLRVTKGQRLAVAVWSDDFSPAIVGTLPGGSDLTMEQAASGHAVARFTAPEDGEMRIGITGESSGAAGAFTLQAALAREAKPINVGDTLHGTLRDGGDMLAGQPVDLYRLHGKAGDSVTISLSSAAFDALLVVQDASNTVDQNDDVASDDTNSRLRYTFDAEGDLEIRVSSINEEGRGAYELSAEAAEPPQSLKASQPVRGSLSSSSEQRNGKYAERYLLEGREGDSVRIDLASTDFDAYLVVQGMDGKVQENDDVSEESTDARITYLFPHSGQIVILATSYSQGETGSYTINATPLSEPEGAEADTEDQA